MKKFITITSIVVLAVVLATMLMACTPSEESLKKKFDENGYAAVSVSASTLGIDEEETPIEYIFLAGTVSLSGIDGVYVVCFTNSDDAKAFYDKIKESENAKKKGNAVAYGSEEALKLF